MHPVESCPTSSSGSLAWAHLLLAPALDLGLTLGVTACSRCALHSLGYDICFKSIILVAIPVMSQTGMLIMLN